MQRAADKQKTLAAHGALLSDQRLQLSAPNWRDITSLEGRVLSHGEEENGNRFLLLEGTDARVYYLRYTPELDEARSRGDLTTNSFVVIDKTTGLYRALTVVGTSGHVSPLDAFAGMAVHAVAGIGNPERFFNMLRAHGIEVEGHPLADHARIAAQDVRFGDDLPVLMTEKDAVKCAGAADERHWYVPVNACFDASESHTLLNVVMHRIANRESPRRGTLDG